MMTLPATENKRQIKAVQDRRFACPGLFRMPLANDGGICRIKLPLGCLTDEQIEGIAEAAQTFSTGYVELTTRANLQIRAVEKTNEQKLINKLLKLGLGPLNPEGDDIRNVMVAPTAGIDVNMSCDTTLLGNKLLEMLQLNNEFASLSPKFSFLINGGETTRVLDHVADIWFSAVPGGVAYNFGFASPALDTVDEESNAIGSILAQEALEFIRCCLDAFIFLSKSDPTITRMKHLRSRQRFDEFLAELKKRFNHKISKPLLSSGMHQKESPLAGIFAQKLKGLFYVGARPELGRLSSKVLYDIAKLIKTRAIQTPIRLTHHQGLIIPDCTKEEAVLIRDSLHEFGLATDKNAPAFYVFCCAGAPLCHSALSNVQRDGKYLVNHFASPPKALIHLTGCPKSCVATVPFPFTVLAIKDGVYNLYRKNPAEKNKFGQLLCENVGISDVMRYIEQLQQPIR